MFAKNLNVLANFIDHNIVLNFLQEMGFEIKDNTNNVVILERDNKEEFSLIAVMCDKKNKNYRAQLINTIYTVSNILDDLR